MSRGHHYRRRPKASADLDMTTFMNLMVVLVPFLLMSAVFSRINVVELTLPSAAGGAAPTKPEFRLEVIVRASGIELSNGEALIAAIPKVDGAYDLGTLSSMVIALKQEYPDAHDASVLLEPEIEYDHLIQVMDVVRSAALPRDRVLASGTAAEAGAEAVAAADPVPAPAQPSAGIAKDAAPATVRVALFTDISVGDAP
ncbi:MAG: biopolymer transporter ExbD [Deltaproteobacteria bacterium]|nr:biopolymer transporter ExbD [Deltaproteobacteria bacterium]